MKNTLVLAPLFFHGDINLEILKVGAVAFLAFCAAASAAYCFNDVIDRERDKSHPTKSNRPIASGKVSLLAAVLIGSGLLLLGLTIAFTISTSAAAVLLLYSVLQITYSVLLKSIAILDVFTLSGMYLLRIVFGATAVNISASSWILVCVGLLALMLALGKRLSELELVGSEKNSRPTLEKYSRELLVSGISSTATAVLVCYLLWCNEGIGAGRFAQLEILPSGLIVGYGLLRYQQLLFSGRFEEDPTIGVFTSRDILLTMSVYIIYIGIVLYA